MKRAAIIVAALGLAACSLAPPYVAPKTPAVEQYKESGEWLQVQATDSVTRSDWWQAFGDTRLDEFQTALADANPDLAAALARYQEARALALQSRAAVFPTVNGQGSARRERASATAPTNDTGRAVSYDDFIAGLNLAWEVDLFGRLRNAARAAGNRAQASAADLAALNLSLHAELATDYFTLRGDDATLKLLDDSIKSYDRALQVTRNRYNGGIAAETDVDQAQTQLENARAQFAQVTLERAQQEHAIAVLLGKAPSDFSVEPAAFIGDPPPFGAVLPSTLLQRRPDVASAERAVAAANAEIGVARAAWFPIFSLTGTAGYETDASSGWFTMPNAFWSLGPNVQLPLLDAGTRIAQNRQARAAYNETVANYRKAALTAYREVEDNLAAVHHLADELKSQEAAAASAQRSVYHADQRYQAGVADYLEVSTEQTAALQAQRAALDVRVQRMNASVNLIRAMGGGWSRDQIDQVASR